MSEQKITPATQVDPSMVNKKTTNMVSTDTIGVFKLNPIEKIFPPKSTTAITVSSQVNTVMVIDPLVQSLNEGSDFYGNPVGMTQSLVVICSEYSTADWLNRRFSVAIAAKAIEVVAPLTYGPINIFQLEGRTLLANGIKPPREVLLLVLPAFDRKNSLLRKELAPLLRAAHERSHTVIVVFQGLSQDDAGFLTQFFNAVINIEVCEPDHGYMSAFTVAPAPGTFLAAVGKRPIINNIRLSADGQIERSHYECVSPSAMTREVAKLVEQGMSYTAIAEQYGVNKTTIMRRMDALPFVPKGQIRRRAS